MDIPPLVLDRAAAAPLATQLADALRAATLTGSLNAGDRLPSTRALATALGVSRTVTSAAFDQLLAEGWVAGRRGAGTFVVAVPSAGAAIAGAIPGAKLVMLDTAHFGPVEQPQAFAAAVETFLG